LRSTEYVPIQVMIYIFLGATKALV